MFIRRRRVRIEVEHRTLTVTAPSSPDVPATAATVYPLTEALALLPHPVQPAISGAANSTPPSPTRTNPVPREAL
jgi:hypothetical protein